MTKEEALKIKELRKTHSWRAIAATLTETSNQQIGRELCWEAAEILGEDPNKEPWN